MSEQKRSGLRHTDAAMHVCMRFQSVCLMRLTLPASAHERRHVQVLELVMFKERLAASHTRALAYTEMAIHALSSLPAPSPTSMLEGASALAQTLRSALPPGRYFCHSILL